MSSDSPPPRDGPLQIRNDGSHRAAAAAETELEDLLDSPAYELGLSDPATLEKLGELDDVVFEAIAGRGVAVDRLRSLWPEASAPVGSELVEESRRAYLQHALSKWHECATAEESRNAMLAVTLMDVVAILLT